MNSQTSLVERSQTNIHFLFDISPPVHQYKVWQTNSSSKVMSNQCVDIKRHVGQQLFDTFGILSLLSA